MATHENAITLSDYNIVINWAMLYKAHDVFAITPITFKISVLVLWTIVMYSSYYNNLSCTVKYLQYAECSSGQLY